MYPSLVVVGTQLLFTASDILARIFMKKFGFTIDAFFHPWFGVYFLIRIVAMFGQLYVFSVVPLGKTMAMFGAVSIVIANVVGLLLLKEVLSPIEYAGVTVAVFGFIILAFR